MYTMVLMMSMTGSGDVASFGKRDRGDCCGAVAVACTGYSAYAGCSGYSNGCSGYSNGCSGRDRGGFLGLCNKDRKGCDGGGFLGLRDRKNGCHGSVSYGCTGYSTGCTGYVAQAPACCGAAPVASYGCSGYAAPAAAGCCAPVVSTGCTGVIVTPAGTTTPAEMPVVPLKETPKKEEKKATGTGT